MKFHDESPTFASPCASNDGGLHHGCRVANVPARQKVRQNFVPTPGLRSRLGACSLVSEPSLASPHNGLWPTVDAQLVEDERDAIAHRFGADTEPPPDAAVIEPGSQKLNDLQVAWGQRIGHTEPNRRVRHA